MYLYLCLQLLQPLRLGLQARVQRRAGALQGGLCGGLRLNQGLLLVLALAGFGLQVLHQTLLLAVALIGLLLLLLQLRLQPGQLGVQRVHRRIAAQRHIPRQPQRRTLRPLRQPAFAAPQHAAHQPFAAQAARHAQPSQQRCCQHALQRLALQVQLARLGRQHQPCQQFGARRVLAQPLRQVRRAAAIGCAPQQALVGQRGKCCLVRQQVGCQPAMARHQPPGQCRCRRTAAVAAAGARQRPGAHLYGFGQHRVAVLGCCSAQALQQRVQVFRGLMGHGKRGAERETETKPWGTSTRRRASALGVRVGAKKDKRHK